MIVLLHPRSTRPKNRRFPLSVLALAAVIEGKEEYDIVDGNADPNPLATIEALMPVELLAVSVMPGPQMVEAMRLSREFRKRHPQVPIVWGGYFPTLYPEAALNTTYVDYIVRGQGEDTFLELLSALRSGSDLGSIAGIGYKDQFGLFVQTRDRAVKSPDEYPWLPYHRLRHAEKYIARTFLGKRTAVHNTSYGCPFRCKFCAVPQALGGRQKCEAPESTAAILAHLQKEFAIDSVQFYDNNFFLREDDARQMADLIAPLKLRWWCEGRIDIVLRFSDATLRALQQAGCEMIFFGAESGSDKVLGEMNKQLTAQQILDLAARIKDFDIIPEFSFVFGNPRDPERDTRETMAFVRRIKKLNPKAEIVVQHYIPTPHPDGMYGAVEGQFEFPKSPEEWASERWYNFTVRKDPALPWLPLRVKNLIDGFETVMECRWPTVQDTGLSRGARLAMQSLSAWRYWLKFYDWPVELRLIQQLLKPRRPKVESV